MLKRFIGKTFMLTINVIIYTGFLFSINANAANEEAGNAELIAKVKEEKQQVKILETSVLYRERMILPEGSKVIVTLEDVSKMDVAADIIATKSVQINGAPPYDISINYDAGRLHDKGRYALRARIENNDQLLFINTQHIDAFGGTTGTPVEIFVEKVGRMSGKQPINKANLTNTYWKLNELSDIPVHIENGNRQVFMELSSDEPRFHGYSGCNRFSGGYQLQQEKLIFNKLLSTKMMCLNNMQLEQHFLNTLINTVSYKIVGEHLTLYAKDNRPVARFKPGHMQ